MPLFKTVAIEKHKWTVIVLSLAELEEELYSAAEGFRSLRTREPLDHAVRVLKAFLSSSEWSALSLDRQAALLGVGGGCLLQRFKI